MSVDVSGGQGLLTLAKRATHEQASRNPLII